MATAGASGRRATRSRSAAGSGATFEHSLEEVGSGPVEALEELLVSVRRRLGEDDAPMPVPVDQWREAALDGASQS